MDAMRFRQDKDIILFVFICEVLKFIKAYIYVTRLLIVLRDGVHVGG